VNGPDRNRVRVLRFRDVTRCVAAAFALMFMTGCASRSGSSGSSCNGCCDAILVQSYVDGCLSPAEKLDQVCLTGPLTKGVVDVCALSPEGVLFVGRIGTEITASKTGWRFKMGYDDGMVAADGSMLTQEEGALCHDAVQALDDCRACGEPGGACAR
jgi:hypothetical protein